LQTKKITTISKESDGVSMTDRMGRAAHADQFCFFPMICHDRLHSIWLTQSSGLRVYPANGIEEVTVSLLWRGYCEQYWINNEIPLQYTQYCYHYCQFASWTS
jgi:hypothetical protein